jgi:hypothetical protein
LAPGRPKAAIPSKPAATSSPNLESELLHQKIFLAGFDVNGELNVDSLNSAQDVWAENGFLETKLDVRTIVDDQYVRFAWDQLGRR